MTLTIFKSSENDGNLSISARNVDPTFDMGHGRSSHNHVVVQRGETVSERPSCYVFQSVTRKLLLGKRVATISNLAGSALVTRCFQSPISKWIYQGLPAFFAWLRPNDFVRLSCDALLVAVSPRKETNSERTNIPHRRP